MALDFDTLIDLYVDAQIMSWSKATATSERSRLRSLDLAKLTGDPKLLYKFLTGTRGLKPYAVKTAFIRAGELLEWLMDNGHVPHRKNHIKQFMLTHAKLFKNSYARKPSALSLKEVQARIAKIEDPESRIKAMQLLSAGLRWTESSTLSTDGMITGKGGKARKIHLVGAPAPDYKKHYVTFYRHLKKVGLTPHVLRKAFATALAEKGANEADLLAIMGWSSIATASSYIGAQRQSALMDALSKELTDNAVTETEPTPSEVPKNKRRK